MTKFAIDTSVLVAAAQLHDLRGPAARDAIESRLDAGDTAVVAGHSLVETYSVLTRLPPHLRLAPEVALGVVRSFAEAAEVVALAGAAYIDFLAKAAADGVLGGQVYDAVIATAVANAGAELLLTFNVRHFEGLVRGLEVQEPI